MLAKYRAWRAQKQEAAQVTIASVVEQWAARYAEQTDVLDAVCEKLGHSLAIEDAARDFMQSIAMRAHGGAPLFILNENAGPGEAAALTHAILKLLALLEGEEPPAFLMEDSRVIH